MKMKRIRLWFAFQSISVGCLFAPDTTLRLFLKMAREVSEELSKKEKK
jgi:hypothetical protein